MYCLIILFQCVPLHSSLPQVLFFLEQQPGVAILMEQADMAGGCGWVGGVKVMGGWGWGLVRRREGVTRDFLKLLFQQSGDYIRVSALKKA